MSECANCSRDSEGKYELGIRRLPLCIACAEDLQQIDGFPYRTAIVKVA